MTTNDHLQHGDLHWFADWPVEAVPRHAAGVYTVWNRNGQFIYVGMAGRGMTADDIARYRSANGRPRGLWERLNSHASGRRSGDQFCVYVADRLVLPQLTHQKITDIGAGSLSLDNLIRDYIRSELGFRFIEVEDGATALALEREVQAGSLDAGQPLLNPR